jgi:hypothetical protein
MADTLRNEAQEQQELQKANFNMKLRIFYLEEKLAKLAGGQSASHLGDIETENLQLKMMLEEKVQELEERNVLLVKARNAIESLQADVEIAKADNKLVCRKVRRALAAKSCGARPDVLLPPLPLHPPPPPSFSSRPLIARPETTSSALISTC